MAQDEQFEALMATIAPQQTQGDNTEMVNSQAGEEANTNLETQETGTQTSEMETGTETQETGATNTEDTTQVGTELASATENAPTVDFNEWVKNETNGQFDTVEAFKAFLDKSKDYDEKATKVAELEKNQLPEDDFVKKLAEMRSSGASKDQITAFIKLNNDYEDFRTMDPKDLKVAKLVLIDGYSQAVAERKVDKEFNLSELEEGSEEYQDALEELRISSKGDLQALEGHKAKLSTVENKAEQVRLENIAMKSAHELNVKQSIPNILGEFKGLGALDFTGKVGTEEVTSNMGFDYDEEFSQKVPAILEFYFNQDIAPITPERIQEAKEYVDAAYLKQNWKELSKNIFLSGVALAAEKADNKFVNAQGVKEPEANPNPPKGNGATQADWENFGKRVFGGGSRAN